MSDASMNDNSRTIDVSSREIAANELKAANFTERAPDVVRHRGNACFQIGDPDSDTQDERDWRAASGLVQPPPAFVSPLGYKQPKKAPKPVHIFASTLEDVNFEQQAALDAVFDNVDNDDLLSNFRSMNAGAIASQFDGAPV